MPEDLKQVQDTTPQVNADAQILNVSPDLDSTKKLQPKAEADDTEKGVLEVQQEEKTPERTFYQKTFVDDKIFWAITVFLLLANIGICRNVFIGRWFGFIMASYSAIANDSI